MSIDCFDQIPGAAELRSWFDGFPSFHDANVLEFGIDGNGAGILRLQAFRTTDQVDDKGFFVLDKHVVVSIVLEKITSVELSEFMQGAILFNLDIQKSADEFELIIESSYGFQGSIRARQLSIEFQPGEAR